MRAAVGTSAPDFSLPDQDGNMHTLAEYRGKRVLLYFYPKDNTPGCIIEACTLRDALPELTAHNVEVLGVSTDSVASHKKFADTQGLPFTLLADETKEVVHAYGVWGHKKFMGRDYEGVLRMSFLIDEEGRITNVYENVKPALHAAEVLEDVSVAE